MRGKFTHGAALRLPLPLVNSRPTWTRKVYLTVGICLLSTGARIVEEAASFDRKRLPNGLTGQICTTKPGTCERFSVSKRRKLAK